MSEEKVIQNLRKCPYFNKCSANICPLDLEVNQRTYVRGEDICPFTIKNWRKFRKGIKTILPKDILKFIPESNIKMLNKRNRKRWYAIYKKPNPKSKKGLQKSFSNKMSIDKTQNLKFSGFPRETHANYWQYPKVMNSWWYILTGSEQKVLDYLLRHTWGYRKTADSISYSQFLNGIKSKKTEKWIDRGCGIKSSSTLVKALKGLVKKGFIEVSKFDGKPNFYKLKLINTTSETKEPLRIPKNTTSEFKGVGALKSEDTIKDITIPNTQQSVWIKKYGEPIRKLLSRYGVEQVKDAIKICEARKNAKNIKNPIGYIIALCKAGAKWKDTSEAKEVEYFKELGEKTKSRLKELNRK